MKKVIIKNGKINWVCLIDKCPRNCCGTFKEDKTKESFFGVRETMIPLTPEDRGRLVKKGFEKHLIKDKDGGWYIKTEKDGTCSFLKNGKCIIYPDRASSCWAYPFMLRKYDGLDVDLNCPGWDKGWTSVKEVKKMVKELIKLYDCHIKKAKIKLEIE